LKRRKKFSDGLSEPRRHKPYEHMGKVSGPKPDVPRRPDSVHWQAPGWMKLITRRKKK